MPPTSSALTDVFVKWVGRYVGATVTYGLVRSVTYERVGSKIYYNNNTKDYETKDMLLVDTVGTVTWNTLAAPSVWPWMLSNDLTRLECAVRGKDVREYGEGWQYKGL